MKKKPAHPVPMKRATPPARAQPLPMQRAPAPKPAAHPVPMQRAPAPKPAAHPVPMKKPAPKKKRKLARAGENCVADACHALTGHWLDAGDDGLFIPEALEALAVLGLIAGFGPADLDDDSPGLILGAELPGPHAVLTVPGGWWSWGELYDPADFPGAVVEEAWEVW